MKIEYKIKRDLYPSFAKAYSFEKRIEVRKDLPKCIINFLIEHERYHLTDTTKFWLWRELKANLFGAKKHWIGFLATCIFSLAPYRIKFYIQRFISKT